MPITSWPPARGCHSILAVLPRRAHGNRTICPNPQKEKTLPTKNAPTVDPEVCYNQNALAIAVALLTGRLELAMLATHSQHTRFAHVAIDEIVAAARNG